MGGHEANAKKPADAVDAVEFTGAPTKGRKTDTTLGGRCGKCGKTNKCKI